MGHCLFAITSSLLALDYFLSKEYRKWQEVREGVTQKKLIVQ